MIDTTTTRQLLRDMSITLESAAKQIRYQSEKMEKDGDLTRAAEVMNVIVNLMPALRLDLLISRPLKAATSATSQD